MRRNVRDTSRLLVLPLVTIVACVAFGHAARAEESAGPAARSARVSSDKPSKPSTSVPLRPGVLAGVGFPRPLAVEGLVMVGDRFAVGVEYGALPTMTVDNGQTDVGTVPLPIAGQPASPVTMDGVRVSLWSVAGDARWFPFGGAFFLGMRAGRQHVDASTTLLAPKYASMVETIDLDAWFLNPRAGFLWAPHAGIAFGIEAGVQVPVDPRISSTMPLSLLPALQKAANQIGGTAIPTVDLLRLGFVL